MHVYAHVFVCPCVFVCQRLSLRGMVRARTRGSEVKLDQPITQDNTPQRRGTPHHRTTRSKTTESKRTKQTAKNETTKAKATLLYTISRGKAKAKIKKQTKQEIANTIAKVASMKVKVLLMKMHPFTRAVQRTCTTTALNERRTGCDWYTVQYLYTVQFRNLYCQVKVQI